MKPLTLEDIKINKSSDFLNGQRDCKNGDPSKDNQSYDYYRGYAAQYQHEQNMEYATREH